MRASELLADRFHRICWANVPGRRYPGCFQAPELFVESVLRYTYRVVVIDRGRGHRDMNFCTLSGTARNGGPQMWPAKGLVGDNEIVCIGHLVPLRQQVLKAIRHGMSAMTNDQQIGPQPYPRRREPLSSVAQETCCSSQNAGLMRHLGVDGSLTWAFRLGRTCSAGPPLGVAGWGRQVVGCRSSRVRGRVVTLVMTSSVWSLTCGRACGAAGVDGGGVECFVGRAGWPRSWSSRSLLGDSTLGKPPAAPVLEAGPEHDARSHDPEITDPRARSRRTRTILPTGNHR